MVTRSPRLSTRAAVSTASVSRLTGCACHRSPQRAGSWRIADPACTQCMWFPAAPPKLIKMCNIVFAVAVQSTKIDRRLCLVELGIGGDNSIVLLVQSPPCGHLLELLAGWDALQHGCIVNLTGVDNKAFCDPETGRLLRGSSKLADYASPNSPRCRRNRGCAVTYLECQGQT